MPFTNALQGPFSRTYGPLLDQDTHYYARLWEIRRLDGVTHRFTDVGENIEFLGFTYFAAEDPFAETNIAPSITARERRDGLASGSMQLSGAMSVDGITELDLLAGKFTNAVILERIVDRRFPWGGVFDTQEAIIADVEFDSDMHILQCESLSSRFKSTFGEFYSYECPHELGDQRPGRCGYDLPSDEISGTISAIENRRTMTIAGTFVEVVHVEGWAARGALEFTDNPELTGAIWTIANSDAATTTHMRITLAHTLPATVVVGNTVDLNPGCDKSQITCISKFNNVDNFGADPYIPGSDEVYKTPSLTT